MPWELLLTYTYTIEKKFFECLDCNNHHTVDYNISYQLSGVGLRSSKNMMVVAGPRVLGQMLSSAILSVDISICGNETSFLASKEGESFGLLANLLTGGAYTTHLLCLRRLRGWTWPGQTCNHSLRAPSL